MAVIFIQNTSLRESLLSYKNLDLEKADSLINLAYFEADQLTKNDVLFIKEIFLKYREKPEDLKFLADKFLTIFDERHSPDKNLKPSKRELEKYLDALILINSPQANRDNCLEMLSQVEDSFLISHLLFQMVKKFGKSKKQECEDLLKNFIKKYPQTPLSELAEGYLRILNY